MLACDQVVTLARCDGSEWTKEEIRCASWFSKSVGTVTDKGLQGAREIHCRIPEKYSPAMFPKIGDFIIHGTVTSLNGIKDLQGLDYGKITNVADNRRGRLRHISVVAS